MPTNGNFVTVYGQFLVSAVNSEDAAARRAY